MNPPTYLAGTIQAQAYRILRNYVYTVLERYELTPTYWSILGMIVEARDGVRVSDIAHGLHIKAPQVTMVTHELADRDLIKSVPHQFDGRAKLLAITPGGKRFVKTVDTSLTTTLSKLLHGLSIDDLTIYNKVLTTIISNAETLRKPTK